MSERTDTEILEELREVLRRISPSAIPDLRGRAEREREWAYRGRPVEEYRPSAIYGLDYVCDYLEAVMAVLDDGGVYSNTDLSCYDERRREMYSQFCVVEGCRLASEYAGPQPTACIRHRGRTA